MTNHHEIDSRNRRQSPRPSDRLGLIVFSAVPYLASPLTLNHDWLVENLHRLHVGGLSTAPALGELLAEWIVRGRPSMDLSFMAPDRIATGLPETELRERCRLQYAHHYWSPETMPSPV